MQFHHSRSPENSVKSTGSPFYYLALEVHLHPALSRLQFNARTSERPTLVTAVSVTQGSLPVLLGNRISDLLPCCPIILKVDIGSWKKIVNCGVDKSPGSPDW